MLLKFDAFVYLFSLIKNSPKKAAANMKTKPLLKNEKRIKLHQAG